MLNIIFNETLNKLELLSTVRCYEWQYNIFTTEILTVDILMHVFVFIRLFSIYFVFLNQCFKNFREINVSLWNLMNKIWESFNGALVISGPHIKWLLTAEFLIHICFSSSIVHYKTRMDYFHSYFRKSEVNSYILPIHL